MLETFIDSITGAFQSHPYIFIFLGLLFAGETILLPAIYFALTGKLSMPYVLLVALISTTIADTMWYYVGLHMKERFYERFITGRIRESLDKIRGAFTKHEAKVLYLSKFVYGTRVAAQVLAGAERMRFRLYISVNILGVLSFMLSIVLLAYTVDISVENIGSLIHDAEIGFLVFVILLAVLHVLVGKYLKKSWYRQ